jgi:hypothetical protein
LEHATIHVLSEKYSPLRVVGRSTFKGFYLYGDLTTDLVKEAAHEAQTRLQAGEHHLAIHPNCGTNLVASGSLAGLATFLVLGASKKRRLEMLPSALIAAMGAVLLAQPLGPRLQASYTTMAELGDLRIKNVRREERGNLIVHYIETA